MVTDTHLSDSAGHDDKVNKPSFVLFSSECNDSSAAHCL